MILKNKEKTKWFILLLILMLVINFGFSQNVKFKRISIDEGLSASSVNTIFQDSNDFIWIGTQDGLNRYDGYHIKTFKTDQNSKTAVSSNFINCFFEDEKGLIYIGTNDQGLSVFNKYTETFTNYKSGLGAKTLSNNSVTQIIELNSNELLIGTADGLNVFNKTSKQFSIIKTENLNNVTNIKSIYKDSKGIIYIATFGAGFYEYNSNSKKLINYTIPLTLLQNSNGINSSEILNLRCITEINEVIWCGSDAGILVFNPKEKKFSKLLTFDFGADSKYNNRIISFAKGHYLHWNLGWFN